MRVVVKSSMVAIAVITAAGQVRAQQGVPGAQGAPGTQAVPGVQAAQPSTIPPAVRVVLEKAARAYAGVNTYRDRAEVTFDLRGRDAAGELIEQSTTNEVEFLFERSDRFIVASDELRVISNGRTVWGVMESIDQYTEAPAPQDLASAAADPVLSLLHQHRPGLVLLSKAVAERPIQQFFHPGTTFQDARKETRNGREGTRIRGLTDPAMPGMGASPFSAWFAEDSGLLEEVRIDLTETFANMLAGAPDSEMPGTPKTVDKAELLYVFSGIIVNQPVAAGTFNYRPGPSMKKVDSFELGAPSDGAQLALIGQEAPVFSGQTLSGEEISLEALRGKVVVLDFWATWCAPCVAVMPQVQKVAERFAGRNVVVIGINQDRAGNEDKVREFLAARGVSFRQILDFEGELGSAYRVSAIPCSVIIDPTGVIQDIDLGGEQDLEQKLSDRIETVLRGERIHSDEALARFALGADDRNVPDGDAATTKPSAGPAALNPGMIADAERTQGVSAAIGGRLTDINGDQRSEFVAPDYASGGLVVLSADGSTVEKVRLRGAPKGFIGYAAPATISGRRGWLVAATEGYGEEPATALRYHDAAGELVWSFPVPTPAGNAAQVPFVESADLDGDSRAEVVALVMLMPRGGTPSPASGKAWLYVLDASGNAIAARQIGSIATGAFITPPGSKDLRTIVIMADNAVKRFTFDNRKR